MTRRAPGRTRPVVLGAAVAGALVVGGSVAAVQALAAPAAPADPIICVNGVPPEDASVAGFRGEQLHNAVAIMAPGMSRASDSTLGASA